MSNPIGFSGPGSSVLVLVVVAGLVAGVVLVRGTTVI